MKLFTLLALLIMSITHIPLYGMELAQPQTRIEKCVKCGKASQLRCSRCQAANYCSRICQKSDWKTHSEKCVKSAKEKPAEPDCKQEQEQEDPYRLVRDNPVKMQKMIEAVLSKEYVPTYTKIMMMDSSPDQLLTMLHEHMLTLEQQYPLLLVRECFTENSKPCRLSREVHPEYRGHFEKSVSTALAQKISSSSKKKQSVRSLHAEAYFQNCVFL